MTQNDMVLRLLRLRGAQGATSLDIWKTCGSLRGAARIKDLRDAGNHITTTWEQAEDGTRWARYVLHEQPAQLTLGVAS